MKRIFIFILIFAAIQPLFAQTWNNAISITGTDDIEPAETAIDIDGSFIIVGTFKGTISSVTPNVTSYGNKDIFIAKFNSNLELQWLIPIGSSANDFLSDIKIDVKNNIVISGSYNGTCEFGNSKTLNTTGTYDTFLAKYSTDGKCIWAKNIATNENFQVVKGFDIDNEHNIILSGFYKNTASIGGSTLTGRTNLFNNFYMKIDSSGTNVAWVKNVVNNVTNTRIETAIYYNSAYYFTGNVKDSIYFDISDMKSSSASYLDMFLYKTDLSGNEQWLRKTYGGDGNNVAGISTGDDFGNVYFTGYIASNSLTLDSTKTEKSKITLNNNGGFDNFIIKYNPEGVLQWAKNFGNSGNDWGRDIEFSDNILFQSGYTSGSTSYNNNSINTSSTTDEDGMIAFFTKNGIPIGAASIDGNDGNEDAITSISVRNKEIFATGYFISDSIYASSIGLKNPNAGTKKALFVGKIKPDVKAVITTSTQPTCNGDADGSLSVTAYFGKAPYTYQWYEGDTPIVGQTNASINNIAAGNYKVIVTDADSKTDEVTVTLSQPDEIAIAETLTNVVCFGAQTGEIAIDVTGGNGGNSFVWQAIEGNGLDLNAEDQTGLTKGSYKVTVTDSKGCQKIETYNLSEGSRIKFDGTTVVDASGVATLDGSIDLNVAGGVSPYTFAWTGPESYSSTNEDISNVIGGYYTVIATDQNTCNNDTTILIKRPVLQAEITDTKQISCNGSADGSIEVTPKNINGTVSYKWKKDEVIIPTATSGTISDLSPGAYKVIIEDDANKDSTIVNITEPATLNLSKTITNVDCNGNNTGVIDLSVSGGTLPYTYAWGDSETSQDRINVTANSYSVTVTDANGCTANDSYTVTQPSALQVSIDATNLLSCFGDRDGVLTANASGGPEGGSYAYQWNDPASQTNQAADALFPGDYSVIVTDDNGCTKAAQYNLIEPGKISFQDNNIINVNCYGETNGVIDLTVKGGTIASDYTYSWDSGQDTQDLSGIAAGTYVLTVTDDNSCSGDTTVAITQPAQISHTMGAIVHNLCHGDENGSIEVSATGGLGGLQFSLNSEVNEDYSTSGTTYNFTGLKSRKYKLRVRDAVINSCVIEVSDSILIKPDETEINLTKQDVNCFGTNTGAINGISATFKEGTTAPGTATFSLDKENYTAVTSFANLTAGDYKLFAKDETNNCIDSVNFTIAEPADINIANTPTAIDCNDNANGAIDITVTGGTASYTYNWSTADGSSISDPSVEDLTGLGAGTYTILVTDNNSCTKQESIILTNPAALEVSTLLDIAPKCFNGTDGGINIKSTGGTGVHTYSWTRTEDANYSANTNVITDLAYGTYTVTVTDANSCTQTHQVILANPTQIVVDYDASLTETKKLGAGEIQIIATGGTGSLFYTLDNWATQNTSGLFTGLSKDETYQGFVKDLNECTVPIDAAKITELITSDIQGVEGNSVTLNLFPNPNNGDFSLEGNINLTNVNIEIYELSGALVYTEKLNEFQNKHKIKLSQLNLHGTFLIRVISKDKVFQQRFVIK